MLDVGCFDGGFLASLGSTYRKFGVEIHQEASRRARERGVTIVARDLQDLIPSETRYDVVTAIDVIEHVANPFQFLDAISRCARRDGIILISTGNTDAWSWRLMKSQYRYCTIPEHISFINPKWCSLAARKLGLRLEQVRCFSHHRATVSRGVYELIINLAYRIAPTAFGHLRRFGLGGIDVAASRLDTYPPLWRTARDHFISMFTTGADNVHVGMG